MKLIVLKLFGILFFAAVGVWLGFALNHFLLKTGVIIPIVLGAIGGCFSDFVVSPWLDNNQVR